MTLALALLAATFTRTLDRVTTLDPVKAQSAYDMRAVKLVHETVLSVDYAARPYRLVPGACELPDVSADGLVYRFRMRSGALGAADVVRELRRLGDPANAAANSFVMRKVASLRTLDARALEIRLRERQHVFPWMLTMAGVAKADGSGTGPFELASWRRNHEMVFRRRPGHACADGFDVVRYLVVDDVTTQWLMFLKGEIDMIGDVSRDNWDAVMSPDGRLDPALAARGVRLYEAQTLDTMFIGLNMDDPVLGPNRKLRQALNCAFDFPRWRAFYSGRVDPCDGPVPPGVDGRLETPFAYAFDLEKARRLLAEAGYPNGRDPKTKRRLELTLSIGRANQESREAGELMASFFGRIGIRLELSFMTWDAFLRAMNERRCQLFRIGWVGDYPDAENFLQLFHSANVSPGVNHANYVNPTFDRAYAAAMAAATAEERNVHWKTCQEIVREDCPWIFTHFPKAYSLLHRRVGNYVPGAFPYGNEQFYKVVNE